MKKVIEIEIEKITPNKSQPRLDFYDESLKNLADSIKENGLLQPIVVREMDEGYELIAGERRYRATLMNGNKTIEAIVIEKSDEESANLALIENMQREGLSAIEEAIAMERIMKSQDITQAELAKQLGYRQSTVANKLRLLKLPEYIKLAVSRGEITERHARAFLKVPQEMLEEVYLTVINRGYNVAKTEEYIKALSSRGNRGVSNHVKIGMNTIKEAYELCRKSGLDADYHITEYEGEVKITIRFKK